MFKVLFFSTAIQRDTGVEFAVKSMDKGTYNKSIYGGCTLPQELVLHSTAAGHKDCEGFCFIK